MKDYYLLEIDDAVAALQNKAEEIEKLRNLLMECKEFLENDGFDVYSWSKFAETEETLLDRINAALSGDKIQANPVDNIKIQGEDRKDLEND